MSQKNAEPWVEGLTIGQALAQTVERYGDRDAAVFDADGIHWSYREFDRQVYEAAKGLIAMGIERGDHVAIWATNVPQWLVLQFATARIGAVLVTINPAYRPFELKYVLAQSDVKALFLIDQFKSSDYFAMLASVCPEMVHAIPGELHAKEFPKLRWVIGLRGRTPTGSMTWNDMLERGREIDVADLRDAEKLPKPTEPINIQYTSGTTGFPKAAMLTHRNLLLNAFYVGSRQRMSHEDRICIPVPFYHCFGCVMGTLCAAVYGAAMIIPAESFDPQATLRAIEKHKATVIYGVPTMFIAQLQHEEFKQRELSTLRTGIMAGSPCPIEIMRQVVNQMGASEVTIAYGQTEASPVVTQTAFDDPLELRVESVGKPLPGVEVKVIDPQTGEDLGDDQQGELCTRGHVVMCGYYNDEEATAQAIDQDGWLHTGDLAVRLSNGYYRITGRIKDMVIRGGENIYPREIEEFLFTHEAIEQAAVVGVPDPKFVEELCAWVKLKTGATATEEGIREFCHSGLAHYKVPRYVRLVNEFPQTITGKIQKFKIREQMIDELGLTESETA
ncbi:Putative acyl-CoA synthetase YngI [Durusdinium trenchii]|uniref:Acyl-CoA synthetase YngI n=1 Tax=Durusdinium trenchii TaxID=1381693 RepID=A0ABP0NVJ7_9DINO